jgi:hypothetical protein
MREQSNKLATTGALGYSATAQMSHEFASP